MKKRRKLVLYLLFALVLNSFVIPVKAADSGTGNFSIAIDIPVDFELLPEDGTPLTFIYPLNAEGTTRNSEYIVFTITSSSVIWNCVGVPGDQIFIGSMDIVNLSTGFNCGTDMSMTGREGVHGYFGIPGHLYRMSFGGALWRINSSGQAVEKVSNESGGTSWKVPIRN